MKNFFSNYWVKLIITLLIMFFIVAYLVGIVFQLSESYIRQLNSSDGGFFAEGAQANFLEINFSPIKNYTYLFSNKFAWPFTIVLYIFLTGLVIRIFSQYFDRGKKDKARGFKYSRGGAYGTAGWLTVDDLDGIAKICTWKTAEGYILGQLDTSGRKLITTDPNSRLNGHVAVFGASGSGKSRCYSRNYLIQAANRRESVIVTDPKGELFEDTAQFFRNRGYVVKIFNLVNPEKSDSWNCLKEIKGNEIMAQVFADTVIRNTIVGQGKSDHFWDNSEMNLLKALILRVERGVVFRQMNKQNMGTVYELLTRASGESGLDELFNPKTLTPEERCCVAPYNIFKQAAENVRGGIILGLGTRLQVFQNEVIKKITEYDDIDLTLPGKRPCAYFCIMSDQDSTLNFLSSLFFSFLFIDLVRYADLNGGKCDVNVNFILDEFPNIGQIVDFTKKISTVRSRGINISVIFQAISQLENRYPDGMWQEILGNCDTHLFLGCNDPKTAKFISDRAGEITIKVGSAALNKTTRLSLLAKKGVRESEGEGKRKLLTMDEVLRTPLDECLIIFRGQNAMRAYKYDYSNHPYSKEFVKTYIRDYPSIFEKEKLLKEQALKSNEEAIKTTANNQPVVEILQPVSEAEIFQPQPNQTAQKTDAQLNKPAEKEMSDIEKLKAEKIKSSQLQNNTKPKKDIFIKNNNQNETAAPTAPVAEIPVDEVKEDAAVGEIILEAEILEEVVEMPESTEDKKEKSIFIDGEKNLCEQFDKTENMLHNIKESLESSSNQQVQTDEDFLDVLLNKKTESQATNSKPIKVDPIFGKDFFASTAKIWKPGDVSQRTKERLEKQAKESSAITVNESIKTTKNGLLLTKKS